ncbi:MAG: ABC transporter ATP-binding protein [Flavobacteriales bacterium]|nr:ABC transporter ATP-binding protein [Flavobacteriales bacterium]
MRSLSHLNKYFFKYKWRLLLGVLFIVIQNIFYIYNPLVVKESVDFIKESVELYSSLDTDTSVDISRPPILKSVMNFFGFESSSQSMTSKDALLKVIMSTGLLLCVIYLAIALIKGLFLFFTRQTIIIMSRLIEYDLKNEIYDQYQRLSMAFYKKNNTGDLMNRISEDVSKVRMYLGPAIMYSINLVVVAILSVTAMVRLNSELTLYVLAPLPVMSILVYYVSTIMNKRSEAVQRQQSALSTFVQENFAGIRVMKAYGIEKQRSEKFIEESEHYKDLSLDQVRVDALFMPTIILLIGISTILAIFLGGKMIIAGTTDFTFGGLVAFVIYVNLLTWPFAAVGWVTSLVQRAAASQERINEFLSVEPEIVDGPKPLTNLKGDIRFENVTFTYPESGIQAIKNATFEISSGKTLGVFGRTGSGKSTLASLLTRQFDPEKGRVLLDNKDIRSLTLDSLRKEMGYVPQEVFLFSDTIANNIAFGLHDVNVSRAYIEKAGAEAELTDEIKDLPKGYDTLLGEWGITLSGGQKQRVSLARAIIRRPKILLFDDSLSAVDTETEESILQTLDRIISNRTTVLISHRISTIRRADHIIVLENGEVIDQGTHNELLMKGGFYAEMERKQSLEIAIEE